MEPSNARRRSRLIFIIPAIATALFLLSGIAYATNVVGKFHSMPQAAQHKLPTLTTDQVLKSFGYMAVTPPANDPLVPFVARVFSTELPIPVSVYVICGHAVPQSECDSGYPAFASDNHPIVFVVHDHILAMLGTVSHWYDASAQQAHSDAVVSAVPDGWHDLGQLNGDQQQRMLKAMPTVAQALTLVRANAEVAVPPFNTKVLAVRVSLDSMALPMK